MTYKAPFPYFGGKSRAASLVWARFGDVPNYVEPFFGSGAVLLARPTAPHLETVNDNDCMISNFWRSLIFAPEAVADFADWPINEADIHARHVWLMGQTNFRERMMNDPDYYDPKIAGWWLYGRCAWVAGGWCDYETAQRRKRVINQVPNMTSEGIHRESIQQETIQAHLVALAQRLRRVRVVCGDWSRVMTPAVCQGRGLTAIFLDPPYYADLSQGMYINTDAHLSTAVRHWAIKHGDDPQLRIALCGYAGEHRMPDTWEEVTWKGSGGFGNKRRDGTNTNAERERIWFSPACLKVTDSLLFTDTDENEVTA